MLSAVRPTYGIAQRHVSWRRSRTSAGDTRENWLSLANHGVFCSRYVKSHMVQRYESSLPCPLATMSDPILAGEPSAAATSSTASSAPSTVRECVCVSFSDLSVWCYECDSYIEHPSMHLLLTALREAKFGPSAAAEDAPSAPPAPAAPSTSGLAGFADAVRSGAVRNIVVVAGAGLSTGALTPRPFEGAVLDSCFNLDGCARSGGYPRLPIVRWHLPYPVCVWSGSDDAACT